MQPYFVVVATDGSSLGQKDGGWAWFIDEQRWAAGAASNATSNQMELTAVYMALQATDPSVRMLILSDSQYVVRIFTEWLPVWERQRWRTSAGKEVKNRAMIVAIQSLLAERHVEFQWIKGHNGHRMNERADILARGEAEAHRRRREIV